MNYEMTMAAEAGELMTAWNLSTLEKRFIDFLDAKPKTIETYSRALHPFTKWTARRGITRPQREDIIAFREELSKGGYSPSTIQLYIGTIKKFFAFLQTEGIIKTFQSISRARKYQEHSRRII